MDVLKCVVQVNSPVLIPVTVTLSHVCFQYEGSVMENTQGVEVMRLKALDKDLEGSENWEAVFDIVKGNEAGYFSIKTDPETNEGILMLDKVLHVFTKKTFSQALLKLITALARI